jgi:NAD-dependent dihydropyrimidine dehydrogenase PreA subunit
MAFVIAEPCIGTKDTACVDACPVDCIHPKKNTTYDDSRPGFDEIPQFYIDPVECIDCGACVPVCPLSEFPAIDATLNATNALLLTLGFFFVRRKRIQAHKVCMLWRLQPPRFFSAAISGTTLTTVSRASPDKAQCAIFTWHCSVRTQFSRWSSCR